LTAIVFGSFRKRVLLPALLTLLAFGASPGVGQEPPIFPSITATPTNRHAPGRFVWHDLVTDDVAAAKRFYGELFGWEYGSNPENERFTIITLNDKPIGGIILENTAERDLPTARWFSSVSVEDVDGAVEAARDRSAEIDIPPSDLPDRGRYSVLHDPQGAALVLLRATGGDPTTPAEYGAGEFLWTELWTRDASAAVSFYEAVLGYDSEFTGDETRRYFVMSRDGQPQAGIGQLPPVDADPAWLPYVAVGSVREIVERVPELGGEVILPPEAISRGSAALIADPTGGIIAVQEWPMPNQGDGDAKEDR
jgi:hypothetical protein